MNKFSAQYARVTDFIKRRLARDEALGMHFAFGVVITVIFIFLFFDFVGNYSANDSFVLADERIVNLVQVFRFGAFNSAMLFITYLGMWHIVFGGVIAVCVWLALLRRWHYIITLVVSVGAGEIFVWFVKYLVGRPRPPFFNALISESTFSFPSAHSFVALSFYGFLTYFFIRIVKNTPIRLIAAFGGVFIILAIGFSRIYLGAHWPSDVIAGYAAGAAWLALSITILETERKIKRRAANDAAVEQKNIHQRNATLYQVNPRIIIAGIALFFVWFSYLGFYFVTHPLKSSQEDFETYRVIAETDIPKVFFAASPRRSEDITGQPIEPINIIMVGDREQLFGAFESAGWFLSDSITPRVVLRFVIASVFNKSYPEAPGRPYFWNALPNDFVFEKPTTNNTVRELHRVHFWKTDFLLDNQNIWFGTAHFNDAIQMYSRVLVPKHMMNPDIDKERGKVKNDLAKINAIKKAEEFQIVEPIAESSQIGDRFFTDGKAYILFLSDE